MHLPINFSFSGIQTYNQPHKRMREWTFSLENLKRQMFRTKPTWTFESSIEISFNAHYWTNSVVLISATTAGVREQGYSEYSLGLGRCMHTRRCKRCRMHLSYAYVRQHTCLHACHWIGRQLRQFQNLSFVHMCRRNIKWLLRMGVLLKNFLLQLSFSIQK